MAHYRKFDRPSGHRQALLRNQVTSFLEAERVVTTEAKSKELTRLADRLITLGKSDSVANRRQAARTLLKEDVVTKLFESLGPKYKERPGGYTRVLKVGARRGDAAPMVVVELV